MSEACIWEALQWHLSPQWPGMPHVSLGALVSTTQTRYTGSIWRSEARLKYHQRSSASFEATESCGGMRNLLSEQQAAGSEQSLTPRFWGDLIFLFLLWSLEGNSHVFLPFKVGLQSSYAQLGLLQDLWP